MGCHLPSCKGPCISTHNIILSIPVHGIIVAKSAHAETTELHTYLEIDIICHQLMLSAPGFYVTIIQVLHGMQVGKLV